MRRKKQEKVEVPAKPFNEIPVQATPVHFREVPTGIVPIPVGEIAAPPTPEQVLAVAQRQIDIRKGYIKLIAKELTPGDVLVFGGKDTEEVYLPKRICMNILSWSRAKIAFDGPIEEHHYSSPDGEFIEFVISAIVTDAAGLPAPIIGNRSTRDEFFGIAGKDRICPECKKPAVYDFPWQGAKYKGWHCKEHQKVKMEEIVHYLPLHDVDIASVRQAAVSNLWNHALEAIGLRPTLQDLKDAGVNIDQVKRIGFGSSRDDAQEPQTSAQPKSAPAEKKQAEQPKQEQKKAASGSQPPKAMVPGEDYTVKGKIEIIYNKDKDGKPLKSKKGQGNEFRKIVIGGVTLYLFDNREMGIDDRTKYRLFDLLDEAQKKILVEKKQVEGAFIVKNVEVQGKGTLAQVFRVLRVGNLEWERDGTTVIQRGLPMREPGEEGPEASQGSYQATDDDIPI